MKKESSRMSDAVTRKLRIIKYVHWLVTVLIFFAFWLCFRYWGDPIVLNRAFRYNIYVTLAFGAFLAWFNKTYNAYSLGFFRIRSLVFSQFLSDFFSTILIVLAVSIAWLQWNNPSVFLLMLLLLSVWNGLWTLASTHLFYKLVRRYHTVVVYRSDNDLHRFGDLSGKTVQRVFHVERFIQYNGDDFFSLRDQIRGYDSLFVAGVNPSLMNGLCKYCAEEDVHGFFLPHIGDVIMSGATHLKSFTTPVFSVRRAAQSFEYLFVKRAFDIFASCLALVLLSPLMLLTALAVKLCDNGPVFYRQIRLTKDGREFPIIKFRSMRVDAEKDGVARLSTGGRDNRITPVGRIIRACRIDELPQLINILKGDMSLVGPRPERPEIAREYEKTLPEFSLRLQVKAGLTGYAQVYGQYNTSPYEKLEFDLMYINNMGVLTDLELLFNTIRILFSKDSTEGFESQAPWQASEYTAETQSQSAEDV